LGGKAITDIRYWSEPERGGHFPACEQPDAFVAEVEAFFSMIRRPA
jgi:pimeloyl-ACP methyl ester carboxylesterase